MSQPNRLWTQADPFDMSVTVHRKGKQPRKQIIDGMAECLSRLKGVEEVIHPSRRDGGVLKVIFKGTVEKWDPHCETRVLDALNKHIGDLHQRRREGDNKRETLRRRDNGKLRHVPPMVGVGVHARL